MGYMFRLTTQSSSGPQEVDRDIQTFTELWDPQRNVHFLLSKRWGSHNAVNVCMSRSTY